VGSYEDVGSAVRVLVLDTETSGISADTHDVIEIAVCLLDTVTAQPISTYADVIYGTENAAAHINRIPTALLSHGLPSERVWTNIASMIERADCILAHNAPFDRRFVEKNLDSISIPWIDSQRQIDWPETGDNQKLATVAIAHGVPIIGAHRALTDVDILVRLLQRVHERGVDLTKLLMSSMTPKPLFAALVSYAEKDLAKTASFSWNADAKRWERRMSAEDAKKLPFKTKVVEGA
jgi:DNA polymerase III subunit epsilon